MSCQPLISIITVVYNGAKTLERAINSVLDIKFNDYEYIIVDGNSTDGSVEIVKKYGQKIFWISERDSGIYDAMNKAVQFSNGKWVYFLGADDQLLEGFEKAVNYLKNENTLYYCNVLRPGIGRIYDGEFTLYKIACRNICHQSIFYPRCVWEKYSYNLKYSVLADYDLNIRCFTDVSIKVKFIPISIAIFSDVDGVSPKIRDVEFERDKMVLIRALFPKWLFVIVYIRTFLISILVHFKIDKWIIKIYRSLQKTYIRIFSG